MRWRWIVWGACLLGGCTCGQKASPAPPPGPPPEARRGALLEAPLAKEGMFPFPMASDGQTVAAVMRMHEGNENRLFVAAVDEPSKWVELKTPEKSDCFLGRAVAVDGGVIAATCPLQGDHDGVVHVFRRVPGEGWRHAQELSVPEESRLGNSVALRDGVLVVGAAKSGRAYVFFDGAAGFGAAQPLTPPEVGPGFGAAVATDGEDIAVGAPPKAADGRGRGPGKVFVFSDQGRAGAVAAPGPAFGSSFGQSVAIEGDRLAVGVPGADIAGANVDAQKSNVGMVVTYTREDGAWSQDATLQPSNLPAHAQLGRSVAIRDSWLAIGAEGTIRGMVNVPGRAYLYRWDAAVSQPQLLQAPMAEGGDGWGSAVGLGAGHLVVGACDKHFKQIGHVALFDLPARPGD